MLLFVCVRRCFCFVCTTPRGSACPGGACAGHLGVMLNELWFEANREGIFYGQCSELCGTNHGFMPIEVHAVSEEKFLAWIEDSKEKYAKVGQNLNLAEIKE